MAKVFYSVNFLLITAIFVGNYLFLSGSDFVSKYMVSSVFVILAFINTLYAKISGSSPIKFQILMLFGSILAMSGDVLIDKSFIAGAALFALGHIFYALAQYFSMKFHALDIILTLVLFIGLASFVLFYPHLKFDQDIFKYVCLAYAFIISVMAGKALSNLILKPSLFTAVFALGALLFVFSDLMLVFGWFTEVIKHTTFLCMGTYFPAQCALVFSILLASGKVLPKI